MIKKNILTVEIDNGFINRSLTGKPIQALTELIWNAFDADATNIYVKLNTDDFGLNSIQVVDDGHGIDEEKFLNFFRKLGWSWKKEQHFTPSGRYLHGKLGQGRYKAFCVGRFVEWDTTYRNKTSNQLISYTISGLADNPKQFEYTNLVESHCSHTGTTVSIYELYKQHTDLSPNHIKEVCSTVFANYLNKYPKLKLFINGELLDPSSQIAHEEKIELDQIEYNEQRYDYSLNVIEWKFNCKNEIHLCNASGLPLQLCHSKASGTKGFSFTAYLKSDHISELAEHGMLELDVLESSLREAIDNAIDKLNTYFQKRKLEKSVSKIDRWKNENIYPYKNKNYSPIEQAEKEMFDILAVNISDSIPNFEKSDPQLKKFQLQLLKQVVNTQPSDLHTIIEEVLNLSKTKQKELANLIEDVSLNSIISMSKVVTERLNFIAGLEEILYNSETKKNLKERAQLHKILAENTWIFGDAFSMTVNDESLTQVLRKHLLSKNSELIIDEKVLRLDGRNGIVDLMLSQRMPTNHSDQLEHLVVELKAPKVKIGMDELNQIESYAFAVAEDERFHDLDTRWNFVIISNELTNYTKRKLKNDKTDSGILYNADNITITVKTWSQIIQECKHRLNFMRKELNLNISATEGLKYIKENYSKYTEGLEMCL